MEIEIIKSVELKGTIDVDFPYYFEHGVDEAPGDTKIYGKITQSKVLAIKITRDYWGQYQSCKVSVDKFDKSYHCYFDDEYASNEEEFNKASNTVRQLITGFLA